jgi:Methylamine utilisation protein MauE
LTLVGSGELYLAILELFARTVCAGILVVAGASKARDTTFPAAVQRLTGLSPRVAGLVGQVLPAVEIALGILLLVGPFERPAAIATALLLAVFASVLVANLVRGRSKPCACFGSRDETPISWWMVLRNLALVSFVQPAAWGIPLSPRDAPSVPVQVAAITSGLVVVVIAFVVTYLRPTVGMARGSGTRSGGTE